MQGRHVLMGQILTRRKRKVDLGYLKCPFFSENTKNSEEEITKYKKREIMRKKKVVRKISFHF